MPTATPSTSTAISEFKIVFAPEAGNGEVVARFVDPLPMVAIHQSNEKTGLNQIDIVCGKAPMDSSGMIEIKIELGKVSWVPGHAFLQATPADCKLLLPAVIEFAYYEGELRKLEEAIRPHQFRIDADVKLAYEITTKHRSQWDRLYRTIEQLYGLRLQFTRLEPHLYRPSQTLAIEGRRIFSRLVTKAQIEDRLEALSDRLEACEDLYEGAADRITDFKIYRKGNLLEIGIIILLALEVALLVLQWHH